VSSAISSAFTYIYVKFIDAGFIQQMMDRAREGMEEKGTMSEEQVDQAMAMTSKFMTPEMMLIFGMVFGIIFGIIIALIVGLFTQKKNPEPFA
jgi:type II secretory pathway component PulF